MKKDKSITTEDGTVYVLKKPFYKKGMFYGLIVTALLFLFFFYGSMKLTEENLRLENELSATQSNEYGIVSKLVDNIALAKKHNLSEDAIYGLISKALEDLGYSEGTSSSDSEVDQSSNINTYSFGESVVFNDNSKVTVNSVREAPEVEMYDVADGDKKVVLEVTVENQGSTPLSVKEQAFSLYDSNSEIGDFNASTYSNNIPNEIAAGMKATLTLHYTTKAGGPFSVSYGDVIFKQ